MQKESRILYKWWDAINFDVRMKTWGGKESKDRGERKSWERAGESRQMPLSRQEASLMRCKIFICVGEKKYSEPGGRRGTYRNLRCAPQYTRTTGVTTWHDKTTMHCAMHCEVAHTDKHKREVRPTPPSDYIKTFSTKTRGAALDRSDVVCFGSLPQNGRKLREDIT